MRRKYLFEKFIVVPFAYRFEKKNLYRKIFLSCFSLIFLGSCQKNNAQRIFPVVLEQIQETNCMSILNLSFFHSIKTEWIKKNWTDGQNEKEQALNSHSITSNNIKQKRNMWYMGNVKCFPLYESNVSILKNKEREPLTNNLINNKNEALDSLQKNTSNAKMMNGASKNELLMLIHLVILVILLIFLLAHAKIKEQ